MRRKLALCLCTALLLFASLFLFSAAEDDDSVRTDSILLTEDNTEVEILATADASFTAGSDSIFLFCVPPGFEDNIRSLVPIDEASIGPDGNIRFVIPFDPQNPAGALNGYCLAVSDGSGGYHPVTGIGYISNLSQLAAPGIPYRLPSSKKGLQVQLTADAQLLGVRHTVINAFMNELITTEEKNSVSFVYDKTEYHIDRTALSMLDYRVKTLTEAGIHIYMNLLLAYDAEAPKELYYPDLSGTNTAMYAVNVDHPDTVRRIAALIHFLVDRYTAAGGGNGFCASYILGYEVNNESENNRAGLTALEEYADSYARLLRIADTAARTAYRDARFFVSLSNRWNLSDPEAGLFGGREFLTALSERCGDLPFGVSINPYPSELSMTDYWNDEKAVDDIDSDYVTLRNLTVLTDYMGQEEMQFRQETRPILVGEFGVSGEQGTDSEPLQAAAYAYAYYTVCRNDAIEALIWHRHVDHTGEEGLYYGLYTAGDLLLDPKVKKALYSVFSAVDRYEEDGSLPKEIVDCLPLLPIDSEEDLLPPEQGRYQRWVYPSSAVSLRTEGAKDAPVYLFDFSESLYDFYPSDNARYLEQCREDDISFLRAALLPVAAAEYMGVGGKILQIERLADARAVSVRIRVISHAAAANVKLLITHRDGSRESVLDCSGTAKTGEWIDLYFPIDSACFSEKTGEATLKLWVQGGTESDSELFLDVASVSLLDSDDINPAKTIFLILILVAAAVVTIFLLIFLFTGQRRKP